ncbi:hypothetical protein Cpin_3366 [Chitinophaga pinensis DSM 2588]|uniref:Uncharacterized protein n=1 Tax=Chitinophaga pinensis (strain ATCC 43595 / DSM 2588 / LMG 13176 / NBRC 15968 / NCIMB 11800 / UQM 2034) TaxID=485918 RepID=A0A979G4Z7_CHIPD|nr:hypothetical protein Cpin_3366 [Chitinophaga pinensis DSM 2588]
MPKKIYRSPLTYFFLYTLKKQPLLVKEAAVA